MPSPDFARCVQLAALCVDCVVTRPAPLAGARLLSCNRQRRRSRPSSSIVPLQLAGSGSILRRLCVHGCEGVGDEVCGQLPLVEELVVAFTAVTGGRCTAERRCGAGAARAARQQEGAPGIPDVQQLHLHGVNRRKGLVK